MEIEVVVEIPKGSRNKYEIDHETGELWLDRLLFTATSYPADYGFVPDTLALDGDALDALVLLEEPTVPGCHIMARPIGIFWMDDEAGPDAKLLCVPAKDARWTHIQDLADLQPHLRQEIAHFFEVYKALEPAKSTEIGTWDDAATAALTVTAAKERYLSHGG